MGLNLTGTVSLDGSGFEAGLKRIEGAVHHAGDAIKNLALSAVGIYGIEQAISKTIETADKLIDTSRRLGVGLEALQELGFAARQNGADIEQLTTFIEKLNSTRIDPKNFAAYRQLGIGNPASGDVVDLIMKLSANVQNRSSQSVIGPLRDIGGREAGAVLATLKDNLAELREEARRVGAVISMEDVVALKYVADQMKSLAQVMVAQLAPALVFLMNTVIKIINGIRANLSIYPEFFKGKGGSALKTLLGAPFGYYGEGGESLKGTFKDILSGFTEAGAHANTMLEELNDSSDAMMERLLNAQRSIELTNESPVLSQKFKSSKPYSDSLLSVGNFLGSSNNPIVSIAQLQLSVLRQIERNTSPNNTGNDQSLPLL